MTALSGGVQRVSLSINVDNDVWTRGGHVVDLSNNSLALVVKVLMAAWTCLVHGCGISDQCQHTVSAWLRSSNTGKGSKEESVLHFD